MTDTPLAASFPLPFRVLFLGATGLLCWATNLHGLRILGIDAASALEIRAHDSHYRAAPLPTPRLTTGFQSFLDPSIMYKPVYRLFTAFALWTLLGWAIFRYFTSKDLLLVDANKFIPAVFALVITMVLVCPFDIFQKRERDLFLLAVRRCLFSSTNQPIYFSDVVLADIFTSFAKVLGDVWLSICMLLPGGSLLIFPTHDNWSRLMVPILMSIPYLVRLRQCLVEYVQPANNSRRPLFNALKYASSFPVIFLSAAQRIVVTELVAEKGEEVMSEAWHGEHPLFRLWLLSVAVNSLYSYWWDVTNDWGLDLLRPSSNSTRVPTPLPRSLNLPSTLRVPSDASIDHRHELAQGMNGDAKSSMHSRTVASHPWGLRSVLLFPLPAYPLAIFINLILRLTWSIKLSSHLHTHADGAVVIFWIEMAELLRRWMWVFFRVEWEIVRKNGDYMRGVEEFNLRGGILGDERTNYQAEDGTMDAGS